MNKISFKIYVIIILLFMVLPIYAKIGDVNYDSRVDIIDALLTARYYVGIEVKRFIADAADVDGSQKIDIIDSLFIARYYVGLIKEFPVEKMEGYNPTTQPYLYFAALGDGKASEKGPDNAYIRVWSEQVPGSNFADGWNTIDYTISGTAENGVDYEFLSGKVAILIGFPLGPPPKGVPSREIVIKPIKDNKQEGPETVIITCLGQSFTITINDNPNQENTE